MTSFEPVRTLADLNSLNEDDIVEGYLSAESGPGARPTHPDWFRLIRDQCAAAGVPFLFKQWGEWAPVHHLDCDGPYEGMRRVGKKAAGRLLDGVLHDGYPA